MTDPTLNDVRKVVGAHGYGFQYAVIRRADELLAQGLSIWVFEAAEFPVGAPERPIHVDFILRDARPTVYLVAECKRADPARANWCFFKAPYTWRSNTQGDELVFQEVQYRPANVVTARPRTKRASLESTHLGIALRAGTKGDGIETGGSGINDATGQVLRAANGLIDVLFPSTTVVQHEGSAVFVPVIFTTARLWVAKGDLSAAHLSTGQLPDDWGEMMSVPWLWYTYNQSPALRHRLPSSTSDDSFSGALHAEYARTIAVVGPDGVDAFLRADLVSWL